MSSSKSIEPRPRRVLAAMHLPVDRIRRIAQRSNTHWLVATPHGPLVLRRYAPDRSHSDVLYELQLLDRLATRGWPVPVPAAPLADQAGALWCAFRYLPGRAPAPRTPAGALAEQRRRGRLLAQLHLSMAESAGLGQRDGWRMAHEGLWARPGQPTVDDVLRRYERAVPTAGRVLRAYADQMRERLAVLLPEAPAPVLIHGDFTPWNLRYAQGTLSAILDFDAAHRDLRVAEFALAWRGRYDAVIEGYNQLAPLEPVEEALVVPIFWAWVIASALHGIDEHGVGVDLAWPLKMLSRTPLTQATWHIRR